MDVDYKKNTDFFHFLSQSSFFKGLSRNALWPLANLCSQKDYITGDVLIKEDSDPTGIFIIVEGAVEVYRTLKRDQFHLTQLGPGMVIGEIATIDKLKTTFTVRAIEPTSSLFISEWDFTLQINAYPEIGLELLPLLTKRIRILLNKLNEYV